MDILEKHMVMQFDICSSSMIIQDLIRSENTQAWRSLLIWIEKYLVEASKKYDFLPYKFVGDGWILLFKFNPGRDLISFARDLSEKFSYKIKKLVDDYLEDPPEILGITFGVDRGTLIKLNIMGKEEYIGWPINVAARLEKARDHDETPQYKMLITKSTYKILKTYITGYSIKYVTRKLKNISIKPFHCMSIRIKEL